MKLKVAVIDRGFKKYLNEEVLGEEIKWGGYLVEVKEAWGKSIAVIDMDSGKETVGGGYVEGLGYMEGAEIDTATVPEIEFAISDDIADNIRKGRIVFSGIISSVSKGAFETLTIELENAKIIH